MAVYQVQELQVVDEGSFCENLTTLAGAQRLPIIGPARFEPMSGRSNDGSIQNRLAERRPGYLLPRSGGTLEFDVLFCGAGVNTETGALSATQYLFKLLKDALGGGNASQVGGVVSGVPTVTSVPYTSGTPLLGAVVRFGQKGDGRADGQAAVVGAVGTPMTLLNALPAAPTAGDKFRAAYITHPTEALGATKRFMMGFTATGAQWFAHGCACEAANVRSVIGDIGMVTFRFRVAYWQRAAVTIPSAVALEDCKAAVLAGGSLMLQSVGTTTRDAAATPAISQFALTIDMPLAEKLGEGGLSLQPVIGYERAGFRVGLSLTMPYDATNAKETDYDADGSDTTHKYFLACFSAGGGTTATEGRHAGFFMPRLYPVGRRPAFTEWNGLLYQTVDYEGREGTDTTNDLTRSVIRFYQS